MTYNEDQYITDRQSAIAWARRRLEKGFVILDTETTGLDDKAEICQIAVIDHEGNELLNTLVRPTIEIPPSATAIHGIRNDDVIEASLFTVVFASLWKAVGDKQVVIYNAPYDLRLIEQSIGKFGYNLRFQFSGNNYRWLSGNLIHCAMQWYSQFIGDWSEYHQSYTWQRLPSGDHSALGDCKATLEIIKKMASETD